MENAHATHKEDYSGLMRAMGVALARIRRRSEVCSRGLVVTPWSGRSPTGWSA